MYSKEFSQKSQFSWDHPGGKIYNANAVSKLQCQHIVSKQFLSRKIVRLSIIMTNLGISFLNPTEFTFPHVLWESYLVNYDPTFVVGKLVGKLQSQNCCGKATWKISLHDLTPLKGIGMSFPKELWKRVFYCEISLIDYGNLIFSKIFLIFKQDIVMRFPHLSGGLII